MTVFQVHRTSCIVLSGPWCRAVHPDTSAAHVSAKPQVFLYVFRLRLTTKIVSPRSHRFRRLRVDRQRGTCLDAESATGRFRSVIDRILAGSRRLLLCINERAACLGTHSPPVRAYSAFNRVLARSRLFTFIKQIIPATLRYT